MNFFCLFAYAYLFIWAFKKKKKKKVEHRKEEKYTSIGDEYSHNFTN